MARLPILEYPDPRLRIRAEPVTKVDAEIRTLVDDLLETMYAAPGIGLAATQVDVHKRVLVIDVSDERDDPCCLINPEIVEVEGRATNEEGCLSVPDYYETVERPERIRVRALDREGEAIAWHLQQALHLKNPIRITFNEITIEDGISEAGGEVVQCNQTLTPFT